MREARNTEPGQRWQVARRIEAVVDRDDSVAVQVPSGRHSDLASPRANHLPCADADGVSVELRHLERTHRYARRVEPDFTPAFRQPVTQTRSLSVGARYTCVGRGRRGLLRLGRTSDDKPPLARSNLARKAALVTSTPSEVLRQRGCAGLLRRAESYGAMLKSRNWALAISCPAGPHAVALRRRIATRRKCSPVVPDRGILSRTTPDSREPTSGVAT